ncbi:MAG: carbon-nitrogen hydrolase family protein [Gammaproteobacteria bacterium]|nr:carbon-nitrogen hydrolase family protein [Gammaproteobacteria bacterium]
MSGAVVAAVQMTSVADRDRNLASARRLLEQARAGGACLAVLPENFSFMGRSEAERRAVAEADGDGPVQIALANAARELGLWIVGGTLPLSVPGDPRPANACLVFDAAGRRVARYDKIHLFDVDLPGRQEAYRESENARPGERVIVVATPAGRLGLSVCYDLRFPELYRRMVTAGAELFSVPAAFTGPTGRAHWEVLLRARAIENLAFVVAAAQAGFHDNGRETYGDSLVADYWGRVLRRLPRGSGVVLAALDRDGQATTRREFPALAHRTLDLT